MTDRYDAALHVLGLEPGATEQAIKDEYRDLVKVWHPDRFGSDPRLRAKAQDKLKEVNAAFERLRGYRPAESRNTRETQPDGDPAGAGHNRASGARPPAPPIDRANASDTRRVLTLVASAVLAGFVGTGVLIWRSRTPPQPASTTTAAPETASTKRAPSTRTGLKGDSTTRQPDAAVPTTGSLIVASRPLGAHVSFDGRNVGETPVTVADVVPGEHRVEVTVDGNGYQPWSSTVLVTAGQQEKLLAIMTPPDPAR